MVKVVRYLLSVLVLVALLLAVAAPITWSGSPSPAWHTETVDASGASHLSLDLTGAGLPRIAYGANGELNYAWHDGSAWHLDTVEDQPGSTGWHPSLVLDSLDNPHISYYSPYSHSLMYAYFDGSWHIEPLGAAYDLGGQTSLALDAANRPRILSWDRTHLTVWYTWHNGTSWQPQQPMAVMLAAGQDVSLDLDLDSSGRPHACYYNSDTNTLHYTHHDGLSWQPEPIVQVASYNGQQCSLALDAQDRPHISYRDLGLWYARRGSGGWLTTLVDDDFFAGDSSSLDLDAQGRPHIGYTDWAVPDQELRSARFSGAGWWIETVDVAAETRRFEDPSLALDAAGRPHIGYWDLGSSNVLKYAARDVSLSIAVVYLPHVVRR